MKLQPLHLISSILVATCSIPLAHGAPPPGQEMPPVVIYGNGKSTPQPTGEVTTPAKRFSELIEIEVLNYQNEKLGRIKAITADLENMRLVEVLVSRGGFLGMSGKVTPVPPTAIKYDATHEVARLNVSKARFDAAPLLPASNAATYSQTDRAAASSRYFGVKPWFASSGLGYVQTSADLEMMQIKSPSGQYLGKVGMVFMDLPTGRIRQIVDDTESMDGNGSRILPPGSLHYNASRNGLVMNENFVSLSNKPQFRWIHGNGSDTHFVEQTNAAQQAQVIQARSVAMNGTPQTTVTRTQKSRALSSTRSGTKQLASQ